MTRTAGSSPSTETREDDAERNAYVVCIPEMRGWGGCYDPPEPPEPYWPVSLVIASTPAEAKSIALRNWTRDYRNEVHADDWTRLRVRRVAAVEGESGIAPDDHPCWGAAWDAILDLSPIREARS